MDLNFVCMWYYLVLCLELIEQEDDSGGGESTGCKGFEQPICLHKKYCNFSSTEYIFLLSWVNQNLCLW